LIFLKSKFFQFRNPVSPTIALEIEEDFVLLTTERTQIVDVKTHILRGNHELEHSVRNLLRPKISRNTANGSLKNHPNRELQELILTICHRDKEVKFLKKFTGSP
jgi:hypothetical protein